MAGPQADEITESAVLFNRCLHCRRVGRELFAQLRGYGQWSPLVVVNGHTGQALSIVKAVDYLLQVFLLPRGAETILHEGLDGLRQAFCQNLRAPFEIASKTALFTSHFAAREQERHQCDASDQRQD